LAPAVEQQTKRSVARFYDALQDRYLSELDRNDTTGRAARATLSGTVRLVARLYAESHRSFVNLPVALDGGCGNGRWSAAYANMGFIVLGVDLSVGMLRSAIRRLTARRSIGRFYAIRADLSNLPLRPGSVDLVHLYGVVEHLPAADLRLTIRESSRVLRPEGLAVIDVPQRGSMSHLLIAAASKFRLSRVPLFRFYTQHETSGLIREAKSERLRLIHKQATGYWYGLFPFGRMLSRLPAALLEGLSRLVFRTPLGFLLILSRDSGSANPRRPSDPPRPEVSVIIPSHNGEKTVATVLISLLSQSFAGSTEILVVDDASTDRTLSVCSRFANVSVVRNPSNLGLANTINVGIRESSAHLVVVVPQDCVPTSVDWLDRLLAPMRADERIGATSSKVELPIEVWRKLNFWEKIFSMPDIGTTTPLLDEKGDAYRKDVLLKIGLFDGENFRVAGEDFDCYFKITGAGYPVVSADARVTHLFSSGNASLVALLKKAMILAESAGALKRRYGGRFKLGATSYQTRTALFLALLLPQVNLLALAGLLAVSLTPLFRASSKKVFKDLLDWRLILVPPVFVAKLFLSCLTFWYGLLQGKQTLY
jgi:glycosyltransferase involved in cell wall biosynthesis/SAM-dependent methyltransferase